VADAAVVDEAIIAPAASPLVLEPILAGLPVEPTVSMPSFSSGIIDGGAAVESAAASDDLLLLDQAWAELDDDTLGDADEDAVWPGTSGDDESVSDMALAAVLDESWWTAL
jgi:hypothetical protein